MKTKSMMYLKLMLMSIFISTPLMAKGGGNGGGAFVCRDADNNITRAYSYDVWSGQNDGIIIDNKIKRLNVRSSHEDVFLQASKAISRMDNFSSRAVNNAYYISILAKKILNNTYKLLEEELAVKHSSLSEKEDYIPLRKPDITTFCPNTSDVLKYETIIIYDDYLKTRMYKDVNPPEYFSKFISGLKAYYRHSSHQVEDPSINNLIRNRAKHSSNGNLFRLFSNQYPTFIEESIAYDYLLLDQKIYLALEDDTHRAALILHEVFYKLFRTLRDDENSKMATEFASLLLSDEDDKVVYSKMKSIGFLKEKTVSGVEESLISMIEIFDDESTINTLDNYNFMDEGKLYTSQEILKNNVKNFCNYFKNHYISIFEEFAIVDFQEGDSISCLFVRFVERAAITDQGLTNFEKSLKNYINVLKPNTKVGITLKNGTNTNLKDYFLSKEFLKLIDIEMKAKMGKKYKWQKELFVELMTNNL